MANAGDIKVELKVKAEKFIKASMELIRDRPRSLIEQWVTGGGNAKVSVDFSFFLVRNPA